VAIYTCQKPVKFEQLALSEVASPPVVLPINPTEARSSRSRRSSLNDPSADERNPHSLEQPCLRHHRTHSFPDGDTNGHVLMIQSPILSRCPAPMSTDSKREHIDTSYTWSAPALEIEKLMTLSKRLTLDGEITPVEAWRRITQHPGFRFLDKANIESLKEMMLPEVMCYG
jgi:hypothetical protein